MRHWALAASGVSCAKAVAMKARTTLRPDFPAWARTFLMKYTRAALPTGAQHLGDGGPPLWARFAKGFTIKTYTTPGDMTKSSVAGQWLVINVCIAVYEPSSCVS